MSGAGFDYCTLDKLVQTQQRQRLAVQVLFFIACLDAGPWQEMGALRLEQEWKACPAAYACAERRYGADHFWR